MDDVPRSKKLIFALIVGMLALVACQPQAALGDQVQYPDFVRNAPAAAQEAYHYAVGHQHELTKYPCYCGCGGMGHTSNLSCYITDDTAGTATLIFDKHAVVCGVCVDITLDVKRLLEAGWSSIDIRRYVDETYQKYGPPTDTPLPTA